MDKGLGRAGRWGQGDLEGAQVSWDVLLVGTPTPPCSCPHGKGPGNPRSPLEEGSVLGHAPTEPGPFPWLGCGCEIEVSSPGVILRAGSCQVPPVGISAEGTRKSVHCRWQPASELHLLSLLHSASEDTREGSALPGEAGAGRGETPLSTWSNWLPFQLPASWTPADSRHRAPAPPWATRTKLVPLTWPCPGQHSCLGSEGVAGGPVHLCPSLLLK